MSKSAIDRPATDSPSHLIGNLPCRFLDLGTFGLQDDERIHLIMVGHFVRQPQETSPGKPRAGSCPAWARLDEGACPVHSLPGDSPWASGLRQLIRKVKVRCQNRLERAERGERCRPPWLLSSRGLSARHLLGSCAAFFPSVARPQGITGPRV